jgi:hypothetical protein
MPAGDVPKMAEEQEVEIGARRYIIEKVKTTICN